MDQKGLEALLASTPANGTSVPIETAAGAIEVPIRPLTPLQVLGVIKRYSASVDFLSVLITGTSADITAGSIATLLLDEAPEALAELIVLATGVTADDGAKEKAKQLLGRPMDEFLALSEAVIDATMPKGVADFFGRLANLAVRQGLLRQKPLTAPDASPITH